MRAALFGLLLCGMGIACLSTGSTPGSDTKPTAAPPSNVAPNGDPNSQRGADANSVVAPKADASGAKADTDGHGTIQLSPYNLLLPGTPEDASEAVRAFNVAAVRAVQKVYHDDADDPSVLLALQDQLLHQSDLHGAVAAWEEPITTALARSTTLQALGPALRALRVAMANAYFDERVHLYREVDIKACHAAFAALPSQDESILNFVVTIEPIGTFPMNRFRNFCSESRAAVLHDRHLPGRPAPESVIRLVRRLYNHAHLGGQVRKVSLLSNWQRDSGQTSQYTLRAVVGVVRPDAASEEDPCTMAEISVVRPGKPGEFPLISEVGEREAILCNQLR